MILFVAFVILIVFIIVIVKASTNKTQIHNEIDKIIPKLLARYEELIKTHLPVLVSKRIELVEIDDYGAEELTKWDEEKRKFTENVLNRDPQILIYIKESIETFTRRGVTPPTRSNEYLFQISSLAIDDLVKSYMLQS